MGLVNTYLICLDILSPEGRVCPKGIGLILKACRQRFIVVIVKFVTGYFYFGGWTEYPYVNHGFAVIGDG